jgi:hypothetical protein
MGRRRRRKWDQGSEEDPGAGLLNLFDVWIAFAVAVLLAMLSYSKVASQAQAANVKTGEIQDASKAPEKDHLPLQKYSVNTSQLSGEGERLGTAYRLKNGEVVYVPDTAK